MLKTFPKRGRAGGPGGKLGGSFWFTMYIIIRRIIKMGSRNPVSWRDTTSSHSHIVRRKNRLVSITGSIISHPVREGLVLCWLSASVNTDSHVMEQPNLYLHSDTTVKLRSSTDVVICCNATWRFIRPLLLLSSTPPIWRVLFCLGWVQKSRLNI